VIAHNAIALLNLILKSSSHLVSEYRQMINFDNLSSSQRAVLSSIAAFLFYGAWAFGVNISYGTEAATKAACAQGGYSFLLTFIMTYLIEGLYAFFASLFASRLTISVLTALLSCAIVFSGSWWVNAMAGTPEILQTVILGYIVGGVYCVTYVSNLGNN